METKPYPQIKIYRDNQLSRWETYRPVVMQHLVVFGNKIDYWFTHNGQWPTTDILRACYQSQNDNVRLGRGV